MTTATSGNGQNTARLTTGPIGQHLIRMAGPMIFGIVAVLLFGVVDSYFVSMLGTHELAAISFTFPVTFVIMNVAIGVGIGTAAVLSRAIGQGKHHQAQSLTNHALILVLFIIVLISIVGYLTIEPLFGLLGATPEVLHFIHEYMGLWYIGIPFIAVPIVANSAIRATGNTRIPSIIMSIAAVLNAILDPLLIFGIGIFPEMGVRGAALASMIAWIITMIAGMWILDRHVQLLEHKLPKFSELFASWKRILAIGAPAMGTNVLTPAAAGILTAIIAQHGAGPVAAFGVGSRIEPLALVVVIALGMSLPPFIGQNFGAHQMERVKHSVTLSLRFALLWGAVVYLLLFATGGLIARQFSSDPQVIETIKLFLWLIPLSYGCEGMVILISSSLNALNLALHSLTISMLRLFVFYVPLAYLGSELYGVTGLFIGAALGNILVGVLAYLWIRSIWKRRFGLS